MRTASFLCLLALGCYESYELGVDDSSRPRDAGRRDAATLRDAAIRDGELRDVGFTEVDAGPPSITPPVVDDDDLPPLPPTEPTPDPDERPSEDDDDWLIDEGEPGPDFGRCCEDTPIVDVSGDRVLGAPVVAWDGSRWLVAWPAGEPEAPRVALRYLDARANPLGSIQFLSSFSGMPRGLTYGNGRFGLLTDTSFEGRPRVVLTVLDPDLRVRANHLVEDEGLARAVGRHPAVGGWIIAHTFRDRTHLDAIDDDMRRTARFTIAKSGERVALVDFKGRVVVVHGTPGEVEVHSFVGRLEHQTSFALPPVRGDVGLSSAFTATRLRDRAVISVRGAHALDGVVTFGYDPFSDERSVFESTWSISGPADHGLASAGNDTLDAVAYYGRLEEVGAPEGTTGVLTVLHIYPGAGGSGGRGTAIEGSPGVKGCAIAPGRDWGTYAVVWWNEVLEGRSSIQGRYMPLVSDEARRAFEASR